MPRRRSMPLRARRRAAHSLPLAPLRPPASGHLDVAARKAFTGKAGPADEGDRADVGGLDVGLDAMQLERAKCRIEHELQTVAHIALAAVGCESVVAEI